jgi:hypothetical protein
MRSLSKNTLALLYVSGLVLGLFAQSSWMAAQEGKLASRSRPEIKITCELYNIQEALPAE